MMTEPKLKARLHVQALLRHCGHLMLSAVVARRGDEDAGTIAVKVVRADGTSQVWTQARDLDGRLGWIRATGALPVDDAAADAYLARARGIDDDLWIVDVESRDGAVPFLSPLLD